jgi:putative hemolysin
MGATVPPLMPTTDYLQVATEAARDSGALCQKRLGPYQLRLAHNAADRLAACRLRFLVFDLELNEGLESAYLTGYDGNEFDDQCDHLIVEHVGSGEVIGTNRLQTASAARKNRGFYSEQDSALKPFAALGNTAVELGRACIHRDLEVARFSSCCGKASLRMRRCMARGT